MTPVRVTGLTGYSIRSHYRRALSAIEELNEVESERVTLDLRNNKWFTPAFITPISVACNQIKDSGTEVQVRLPADHGIRSYMNQIGFPFGFINPEDNYQQHLPLCRLNTDFDAAAIDMIGGEIRRLVKRHFSGLDPGQTQGINLPISEIIDNVDQHADCDCGAVLVQRYESQGYLDLCIVDDGITIPGNFERHDIAFETDSDALRMAANGEVSTRRDIGDRERGYGIRTMTQLITEGLDGSVLISSRGANLLHTPEQASYTSLDDYTWDGTLFIGRMNLPDEGFNVLEYII